MNVALYRDEAKSRILTPYDSLSSPESVESFGSADTGPTRAATASFYDVYECEEPKVKIVKREGGSSEESHLRPLYYTENSNHFPETCLNQSTKQLKPPTSLCLGDSNPTGTISITTPDIMNMLVDGGTIFSQAFSHPAESNPGQIFAETYAAQQHGDVRAVPDEGVLDNPRHPRTAGVNEQHINAFHPEPTPHKSKYHATATYNNFLENELNQIVPNANNNSVSPINMEEQEVIKTERKRMRNRVAASKCRKRKLEKISLLENKVEVLKKQNVQLSSNVSVLRHQVAELKTKVMSHVSSGCQIMSTQHLKL